MEVTWSVVLILCTAFFIAGFIDSIAGGGGLITLPALLLCGIAPHYALGTGKFAGGLGSLTALWSFFRGNYVTMKIVPVGFVSSFCGAMLGSWAALQVDSEVLGRLMIVLLPVGLGISLCCGGIKLQAEDQGKSYFWVRLVAIGLLVGGYDGFFGPGAGSFFLIGLHVLLGMGLVHATANAKVLNLASNFGSVCAFATVGTIAYTLAVPCALASILGNRIGARYAMHIGASVVRKVLYFVLCLLLASLVIRFYVLS